MNGLIHAQGALRVGEHDRLSPQRKPASDVHMLHEANAASVS